MFIEENEENEQNEVAWSIEVGSYPGVCIGIRSYPEHDYTIHVLYIPFFDIALTIYK